MVPLAFLTNPIQQEVFVFPLVVFWGVSAKQLIAMRRLIVVDVL
jgi:hypothetical protein